MTDTTLNIKIALDGTGKAESDLTAVNRQISAMAEKAKGAGSATNYLNEEVAKSATAAKAAADAFEREAAAKRASITASGQLGASAKQAGEAIKSGFGRNLQNVSYQMQDVIVQMNGGVSAAKALGQQLPQVLVGFGAAGAAIGVVAALLPNLIQAFGSSAENAKTLDDAMSDLNKAVGAVGSTVKTFDMDKLYEQFNASSVAVRNATLDQLAFQKEFIKTQQLVSSKKFGESLGGLGEYGTLQKLAGSFGAAGSDRLSKQLGISGDIAKDLLPILNGLKAGTEDVNLAFTRFGTVLLSGNAKAVDLASTMADLAKAERDAAAASSAISEAQAKMSKGHVQTKKEAEELERVRKAGAAAAQKEAEALKALMDSINGKASEFDTAYVKNVETLLKAYDKGALSLGEFNEVFGRYVAMQPGAVAAEKERVKLLKEEEAYREKSIAALAGETEKLLDKALASEKELELIGLSASDLENLTAKRYDEEISIRRAEVERLSGIEGREAEVYLIEQQISALERLKSSDISKGRLQESAREWQKFTDDIERSLTDALYRAFESGDTFGEAFAKSLENTFKAMVLKFAVQMVVGTGGSVVASAADAVLGTSFSKSGGGSGSSLISGASNLSTAYSWGSTAADLAFGSSSGSLIPWLTGASAVAPSSVVAANAVGAVGGDAIGALIAAEGWSSATAAGASAAAVGAEAGAAAAAAGAESAAAGAAAGAAAEGAGMTAASAIPYVGWVIAAVAAIAALGGSGPKEYTGATALSGAYAGQGDFYGWSGADWKRDGGWFSSDSKGTKFELVNASTEAFFEKLYGATAKGFIDLGKSLGDTSVEELLKGFSTTISARSEFGAFFEIAQQVSDQLTTGMAKLVMPAIGDVMGRTGITDAAQAMTVVLTEIQAVRNVLDMIGKTSMTGVTDTTLAHMGSVADRIVLLFGSIDNLNSAVGTYYQNFFSAAEQSAKARESVNASLTALNLPLVETKDQFRALVDSLNLGEVAGQNTFKALMDLAPAFAAVADAASAAQAKILEDRQSWQNKLDVLTGATTERQLQMQADLASTTDATTQALIRQVYAQEDLNGAAAQAAEAAAAQAEEARQRAAAQAEEARQRAAAIAQERYGLETALLQAQGDTLALRERDLAALDESNRALQEQIWALEDAKTAAQDAADAAQEAARLEAARQSELQRQAEAAAQAAAAIANEHDNLQKQLWQAQGDTVSLRAAELAALNPANRALQEQIWLLQDQAEAAQKLAQVESERLGLQKQLWQLQGNTAALRAAELAALDPANRALQEQIWALEDSKKAADEWSQTWGNLTDSLLAQAKKIRGELAGDKSSAYLQSQFAIDTAAARAGDATAAGRLVGLSSSLLSSYSSQAGSALDYKRMQAYLASSLEGTAAAFPANPGGDQATATEIKALREENRAQAATMARLMSSMDKLYSRWDRDGLPATRVEV